MSTGEEIHLPRGIYFHRIFKGASLCCNVCMFAGKRTYFEGFSISVLLTLGTQMCGVLCSGVALCISDDLVASLASIQDTNSLVPTKYDSQKCLQTLPDAPLGQNHISPNATHSFKVILAGKL